MATAKRLQANLAPDWLELDELPPGAKAEEIAWNIRLHDTQWILNQLSEEGPAAPHSLACFFDSEPIGIATCEHQKGEFALEVNYLVTHPGQAGAGGALIEKAATLSAQLGLGGRLSLTALEQSEAAYAAMGFVNDGAQMTLDPSSTENASRWFQEDGQWKLRKYLEKPLLTGMAGPLPAWRC